MICYYINSLCLKIYIFWDDIQVINDDNLPIALMIDKVLVQAILYRVVAKFVFVFIKTEQRCIDHKESGLNEHIIAVEIFIQHQRDNRIQEGALVYGALKNGDVIKSVGIDRGGDGTVDETHDITRSYMLVDLMLTMRVGDVLTINIERTENEVTSDLSFDFTMTEECIQTVK